MSGGAQGSSNGSAPRPSRSLGRHVPTEQGATDALHDHVVERALLARERYGPEIGAAEMYAILADRDILRYPVEVCFDAAKLQPGEFAWAEPAGDTPKEGFTIVVHPRFEGRDEALPLLIAYHCVSVNYGDIVTADEAELFGATLLGMEIDEYYERLCRYADELEDEA